MLYYNWHVWCLVKQSHPNIKPAILCTGGDHRAEFVMGGDEGSVLLARQLDWETQPEYNLTISVSDGVHIVYTQVTKLPLLERLPSLTIWCVWLLTYFLEESYWNNKFWDNICGSALRLKICTGDIIQKAA